MRAGRSAVLDVNRAWSRRLSGRVGGSSASAQRCGSLKVAGRSKESQRVTLRVGQDASADAGSEFGKLGVEKAGRRLAVQRPQFTLGQAAAAEEGSGPGPRRGQQSHPGAAQASGDESEDQGAGSVQPRQVVEDHEQRPVRGCPAQQGERRVRDHQPVGGRAGGQAQGDLQGVAVRGTELCQFLAEGKEDLVEARKAHVRLELHAGRAQHPGAESHRHLVRRIQESRLAHAWLARQQQCRARDEHLVEERPDGAEISVTSGERHGLAGLQHVIHDNSGHRLATGGRLVGRYVHHPASAWVAHHPFM